MTRPLKSIPADVDGHTSVNTDPETWKYRYAQNATRGGLIPTMPELKEVIIDHLSSTEDGQKKLECNLQKFLREKGHQWLWTPAYCPWVRTASQPDYRAAITADLLLTACVMPPEQLQPIETYWATGKNHAARQNRNKRTMRQCMGDLRDGWYGNKAWREWCAAGEPKTVEGTEDGQPLTEEERCTAARARFGKEKTAADWIPRDCHRPVNCAGLIRVAKQEADAMIKTIPGISGTLEHFIIEEGAKFVSKELIDRSDLIGLPADMALVGNDIVTDEQGQVLADPSVNEEDVEDEADVQMQDDEDVEDAPASLDAAGPEEQQHEALNRCICCNCAMEDDDEHLVCERCGGGL